MTEPQVPTHDEPLARWLGLDSRSLSAMRIGLGLTVLVDLVLRAQDLGLHYSDAGVLPRAVWSEAAGEAGRWSLHALSGSAVWAGALFAIGAASAICITVGVRTRACLLLSWLLHISMCHRNPFILAGGDIVLGLLMFWSLFMPIDRHWTVGKGNSKGNGTERPARRVFTVGVLGFLLQVALLYWTSVKWKSGDTWQVSHDALAWALQLDIFTTPASDWLSAHPALAVASTRATLWVEMLAPLVLLFNGFRGMPRLVGCVAMVGFHLGTFAFMRVGTFPFVMSLLWVAVLPGELWSRWRRPPAPGEWVREGLVQQLVPAVAIPYLMLLMYMPMIQPRKVPGHSSWLALQEATLFYQRFAMFTPDPPRDDGWPVVFVGEEELLRGEVLPSKTSKPEDVVGLFGTERQRQFAWALILTPDELPLGLWRSWGRTQCTQRGSAETFDVGLVREENLSLDGETRVEYLPMATQVPCQAP